MDDSQKNLPKAAWSVGSHNESRAERVALTGRGATVFGSKRFRKEQCRPERRSARSINVCERMDEPWRLPAPRILLLLTLALLPRLAQAQRIGPLVPDRPTAIRRRSSAERKEAVRPPSLQLSLPSAAAVALPPLGPDDLQRLQPQEGRPPVIGVHRRLPAGAVTRSFSGGGVKTTAEGAWQSTEAGRLWRLKLTSPSARAMRVHFRDFAIGSGSLWMHSADGQTVGPYTGSGLYDDGDFWSGIVFGDSLTIEYLPDPAAAGEAVPFQIVAISHIWDDAFGDGAEGGAQLPEAAWGGSVKALPGRIDLAVGTPSKKARLTKATQAIPLVERSASLQPPGKQIVSGEYSLLQPGAVCQPDARYLHRIRMIRGCSWKFPRMPPV